MSCAKKLF